MKNIKRLFIILLLILTLTFSACTNGFEITLDFKVMEMYVGETAYLSTNLDEGENQIEWTSSNPEIVSVSETGIIEALSEGRSDVIAKSGELEAKVMVIVKENELSYNPTLKISGPQYVGVDKTITLKLDGHTDSSYGYIVWTVSDESIAEVASDGTVTGIKPGLVNVRASLSSNSSIYTDYSVLVKVGSGAQDVIYNYIYNYSYNISGNLDLSSLNDKVTSTVEKVKDGVIGVSNYLNGSLNGIGTGVIYKKVASGNKYIYTMLTNYHVIDEATQVKAYIGNELEIEMNCNIIKTSESLDLAILTFEYSEELPVLEFSESNSYVKGDFVLAIGNPTGYDYYNSVTFGIISYVKRTMTNESAVFIQHDAAINPGNSGGPLLNLDGKIIGINTLKIASVEVEGMGFAIDLEIILDFIK